MVISGCVAGVVVVAVVAGPGDTGSGSCVVFAGAPRVGGATLSSAGGVDGELQATSAMAITAKTRMRQSNAVFMLKSVLLSAEC